MKTKMRNVLACLIVLVMVFGLVACAGDGGQAPAPDPGPANQQEAPPPAPDPAPDADPDRQIVIGVSIDFLLVERRVILRDSIIEFAEAKGWEVDFQDAQGDEARQLQQVEGLIARGVDALLVLAHNAEASTGMVAEANEAGIPFIAMDRMIDAEVDYFVGMDNDVIGDMMAEYVFNLRPYGNWVLIAGSPVDPNAHIYREGWMRIIGDAVDAGDIVIVGDADTEGWDPNLALQHMENFLTRNDDQIDVALVMNDGMAGGVVQALRARDLGGQVLVTGQDGDLTALQRIVEGDQTMTIWKPDRHLAYQTIVFVDDILNGRAPPTNAVLNNGVRDVPSYLVAPMWLDINNLEEIIIDAGFFTREQIFQ